MGYLIGGRCVADLNTARNVMCAETFPATGFATNNLYVWECTAVNQTTGVLTIRRTTNGGSGANNSLTPSFATCDVLDYPSSAWDLSINDGAIIGAAITAVWLAAAAWKYIRRVMDDPGDRE